MTICNLNLAPQHVWMVSDTLQFTVGGTPDSFAFKASVFPHIFSVVGFRGLAKLHHRVDVFMNGDGRCVDIEDAAEPLPERLRRWQTELREQHPEHRDRIVGQIWLCGWRPGLKAFGGWEISSERDFEPVELAVPGTYLNPGNEYAPPPAELSSPDVLVKVGELQRRLSAANVAHRGAELGIGGELTLVEITAAGFTIRKVHRFDDYLDVKQAIRDGR